MSTTPVTYLADYRVPEFLIEKTHLTFELHEGHTDVSSQLTIVHNPKSTKVDYLVLHGEQLELLSLAIDERPLGSGDYQITPQNLTVYNVPERFVLQCKTRIYPEKNTALEGLYRSSGMYCTQCEAEGFRKITYYLDRPDVMSEFETVIIAEEGAFSTMLSNGNCLSDTVHTGKRIVHWHDPFRKPSYLFALVAGNLVCLEDHFSTQSGRQVLLQIYTEAKDSDKCHFAMQSLKKAMRWDEQIYGREYDLDRFMIVAVDDFNMGAMENKGLNIFNTSCVLAHPASTTDAAFQRVERVIGHEYFHNWSGNRVTCRDWFQLSLKEGLTVYRDSEFSADMNSRAVKRIEDANVIRSVQFVEDAGPMAHPVRPDSYMEISNFYTVTIYEKGAEVVRMLANILGPEQYRRATDLYFSRFDGQAVTCDDFVQCMETVSGKDLRQFRLWYSQAGTPQLHISDSYDAARQQYSLIVRQHTPATPGQTEKKVLHIPLKIALYGGRGALALMIDGQNKGTETVLDICQEQQTIVFEQVTENPAPSLLRGFSAPVKIFYTYQLAQLQQLILLDSDGFCRWDTMQSLMRMVLCKAIDGKDNHTEQAMLVDTLKQLLADHASMDAALLACMLDLPSEQYLASLYDKANPTAISQARTQLQQQLATQLQPELLGCYQTLQDKAQGLSAPAMAARSLRNRALAYLLHIDDARYRNLAQQQFTRADNMTDQFAALRVLAHAEHAESAAQEVLQAFYQQWQHETLVVNMWFQVQATRPWGNVLQAVHKLLNHAAFDARNPNKLRAVIAAFANQNFASFHDRSGKAYQFLADQIADIDQRNPQMAARLLTPLTHWHQFIDEHATLMRAALESLAQRELSKDVYEVVSKSLN
ncbi:alanyl aminopeptidase. Metallo peptidase. MEROPS family M01 [Nitrosomonas eutropha]|uniref:Aminopeptidase N n=1 Tax=Nitrosomonas eutropha TaxID=916 RepID=A0A1I7HSG6_9PROT|nr:aminopeptidase N [Nitrosomonas eutropha]SFU63678.1 alanyl aminopeptidase. Metallo peptidase. MEROPS family M01 [Nitrosomonas eutropha]